MDKETASLLKEILDWMTENSYETGHWGGLIFDDVQNLLAKHGFSEDS